MASGQNQIAVACHLRRSSYVPPKHCVLVSGAVLVTRDGKWPAPDQIACQTHPRQSSSVLPKHCVLVSGAVLVTPDGKWPAPDQEEALEDALKKCGIKRWELYKVDNSSSAAAPLTVPEGPMKTVESEVV